MNIRLKLAIAPCVLALAACGGSEDDDHMHGDKQTLTLSFTDLPQLGASQVYEGWIIVDGQPVTTGRFTVDGTGALSQTSFELDHEQAEKASDFVLTLEPAMGDDPAPSKTHILAGPFATPGSGSASLTMADSKALGTDFASAAGSFILATPTTGSTTTDDNNQGIWWLDFSGAAPAVSLTLPELPEGWRYEGWVADISGSSPVPITTGVFTSGMGADSDGAGPTAGPDGSPPFPGQDFIMPARDLTTDHMAVISVEPFPDDSPDPFHIKPLAVRIGSGTGKDNPQTMDNNIANTGVSGTATWATK